MRRAFPFVLILLLSASWTLKAQDTSAAPADLTEFLARYEDSLRILDQAYEEFTAQGLPLRNEWGQPLARHRITDRQRALEDLRATLRSLRADPQDLVSTTRLLIQSEALVDDLFDVSQIAFDNDSEELGKRLSALMRAADDYNQTVESYALELAERQQSRLRRLQDENQRLLGKAGRGRD
jgi:hypothetical protein